MHKRTIFLMITLGLIGCATTKHEPQQLMNATFYNMQEDSFSIQVVAPVQVIREFAICKAIWFSEKKGASKMALGDPVYGNTIQGGGVLNMEPQKEWNVVDATAYLSEPKNTSNPFVSVPELATKCRAGWDWYR